jgi:arginine deiminase
MSISETERMAPIDYGCDELGRLESVLVHTPGEELELIDAANHREWLFDAVPDVDRFAAEHRQLVQTLEDNGVKTFQLTECVDRTASYIKRLPNLTYVQDLATVSKRGAILSRMAYEPRRGEEIVVREALRNLGVPVWQEFDGPDDIFEGCLALSPSTLLVARTERHHPHSVEKFVRSALDEFEEVIHVDLPHSRRYRHPTSVFNMIGPRLALAYLPVFRDAQLVTRDGTEQLDFARFLARRGIQVMGISDGEQQRGGCEFLPLDCGVLFHFDTALDRRTLHEFCQRGVELILFHPEALLAGGGGLRSLTLQLCRRPCRRLPPRTGAEWE